MELLAIFFAAATAIVAGAIIICACAESAELCQFFWHTRAARLFEPSGSTVPSYSDDLPFVSLHVPVCREPVEVVTATLNALAELEYNDYEIIVVYNNTIDPELWRPIEKLCQDLGPRFRFFFVRELPGFKAGAMNFALTKTAANADLIGAIDCDYLVQKNYLRDLVGRFGAEDLGFLQTPQDYRRSEDSFLSNALYWEYWQFFAVGMQLRDKPNAIMLHGTMCLIKASALRAAGGWSEWCVTEDSELGLKLLSLGYRAAYVMKSYGFGLLPFSFIDYKRQRWRWAAGTGQQIRSYVFGSRRSKWRRLTFKQRALILQGWAPWVRDALVVASVILIGPCIFMSRDHEPPRMALTALSWAVGLMLTLLMIRQALICLVQLRLNIKQSVATICAILSLTTTVGLAVGFAFFGANPRFRITPKQPARSRYHTSVLLEACFGGYILAMSPWVWPMQRTSGIFAVPLVYFYFVLPAMIMARKSRRAAP